MRTLSGMIALLLLAAALTGCGGGGGGSRSAKAQAREKALGTTRLARTMFSIVGLGRHSSRAAKLPQAPGTKRGVGSRLGRWLMARQPGRAPVQGFDTDSGLYYRITTSTDSSSQEALFTDAAYVERAGQFDWSPPQWANGKPDTYPVNLRSTYQIDKGNLAGIKGTLDATLDDASGDNGKIHLTFQTTHGESGVCDFTLKNGVLSAKNSMRLSDGTRYEETDTTLPDGTIQCAILFDDGSSEAMTSDTEGSGSETITDPGGHVEATDTYDDSGQVIIEYDDGTIEVVDSNTMSP